MEKYFKRVSVLLLVSFLILAVAQSTTDIQASEEPNIATQRSIAILEEFGTYDGTKTVSAKFDAPLSDYVAVRHNGRKLILGEVEVTEGSTVVTLTKWYLNKLNNGDHTIEVEFTGGVVVPASLKVENDLYSVIERFDVYTGNGPISTTFKDTNNELIGVDFGGTPLDPANYTLSGNTTVTLHEEFLKTLDNDLYYITFSFSSGFHVLTSFQVRVNNLSILENFPIFNGSGSISTRINGDFNDFRVVIFQEKILSPKNYTVSEGSTIITLHEDFLKTLSNGNYQIEVGFNDGTILSPFIIDVSNTDPTAPTIDPKDPTNNNSNDSYTSNAVNNKSKSSSVNTGVQFNIQWIVVAGLACTTLILSKRTFSKKQS